MNKSSRKNLNIVNIKRLVISQAPFPGHSLPTLWYTIQQSSWNYFLINQEELEVVPCGEWFGLECLQAPGLCRMWKSRQTNGLKKKMHRNVQALWRTIFTQNCSISKGDNLHDWDISMYHKHNFLSGVQRGSVMLAFIFIVHARKDRGLACWVTWFMWRPFRRTHNPHHKRSRRKVGQPRGLFLPKERWG